MKIPLRWTSDSANYDMLQHPEGPIAEVVLEAEIGNCNRCGKDPRDVGSGVIVDQYLYILNEPGLAWCLDPATGEKKWEERLAGGVSWSSMNHVAGRLYVNNTHMV